MVNPAQRRAGVRWAEQGYQVSERRAWQALGAARFSIRYRSVAPPREALRARIRELAVARVSYGYRRIQVLVRREGWPVNQKLVERLYREEGLTLRRKRPKRRRAAVRRKAPGVPKSVNEHWAMDFSHDTLAGGASVEGHLIKLGGLSQQRINSWRPSPTSPLTLRP